MGILADEAKKRSPYLLLGDGESIVGIYKSFDFVPNQFDPKAPKVPQFTIEVDGEDKFFKSSALSISMFFDSIEAGTFVKITKTGEGRDARYQVSEVKEKLEGGKKK